MEFSEADMMTAYALGAEASATYRETLQDIYRLCISELHQPGSQDHLLGVLEKIRNIASEHFYEPEKT